MNLKRICLLALILFTITSACKKKDSGADPCDNVYNQSPPVNVILQFKDKISKENIILDDKLTAADVEVTDGQTGKTISNWRLVNEGNAATPLNGLVVLFISSETPGTYTYNVKLKDREAAKLAYTVTKKSTDNPCKPFVYPISDIKVTNHTFTLFTDGDKSYPNILIVEV